jgi:4-hydroxybenzoate polyprenyltransferase
LALMLTALILLYNALHKLLAISPILMGGCRILLYLTAAATGEKGVTGEAIWKGLALGSYVVGLSCLARKETSRRVVQLWPASLLAAPVLVAFLVDNGSAWKGATFFSVVLALWSYRSLSASLGRAGTNVGYTVSHLLAGIVLVDLLAVANPSLPGLLLFALCFVSALLLQRSIPAT